MSYTYQLFFCVLCSHACSFKAFKGLGHNSWTSCLSAGRRLDFPVLIAPMAMQRMAHTDGENATARAAAKLNIPMVRDPAQVKQTQGIPADTSASHQPILWTMQSYDNCQLISKKTLKLMPFDYYGTSPNHVTTPSWRSINDHACIDFSLRPLPSSAKLANADTWTLLS